MYTNPPKEIPQLKNSPQPGPSGIHTAKRTTLSPASKANPLNESPQPGSSNSSSDSHWGDTTFFESFTEETIPDDPTYEARKSIGIVSPPKGTPLTSSPTITQPAITTDLVVSPEVTILSDLTYEARKSIYYDIMNDFNETSALIKTFCPEDEVQNQTLTDIEQEIKSISWVNTTLPDLNTKIDALNLTLESIAANTDALKLDMRVIAKIKPPKSTKTKKLSNAPTTSTIEVSDNHLLIHGNRDKITTIEVYRVITNDNTNDAIYQQLAPFINSFKKGHSITILLIGQSGSGKSHTLTGRTPILGIVQKTLKDIFDFSSAKQHQIYTQLYEFMNKSNDLVGEYIKAEILSGQPLRRKHKIGKDIKIGHKLPFQTLVENFPNVIKLPSFKEGVTIINQILKHRTVRPGATNATSSRRHLSLTIVLQTGEQISKLHIFDICGLDKSGSEAPVTETATINTHNATLLDILGLRYGNGLPSSLLKNMITTELGHLTNLNNKLLTVIHLELDKSVDTSNKFLLAKIQQIIESRNRTSSSSTQKTRGSL